MVIPMSNQPLGEVVKNVDFYDYQAKYIDNEITMAIPAAIDESAMTSMRIYAETAFKAIGACGLSRCDFFLGQDGQIYLNELNTMPYLRSGPCIPCSGSIWD